jgi:Flp pilus assembly secretin CpaC
MRRSQFDPQGHMSQGETASRTVTDGFTLTVTPQISVDGVVHLSVNPNVTQDTGVATSPSGVAVPIITVREAIQSHACGTVRRS